MWKFGLLGSSSPQVSGWFERWAEPGRGKYVTVHANWEHVWTEFLLPDGLVGRSAIKVCLNIDKVHTAPGDPRRLGLAVSRIEIR